MTENKIELTRRELLLAGVAGISGALGGRADAATQTLPFKGKVSRADLRKTMIWAAGPEPQGAYFAAFRRQFVLPDAPGDAVLHLFADVRYLLWVNGSYVSRGPARFHPKSPEYDTIPLTPFLRPGKNTIAVVVMANASNGKMMHHAPGLTARLETTAEPSVLVTDTQWRGSRETRYGPPRVQWGNVRDRIDMRAEDGDWTLPDYDDAHWQAAVPIDGEQWGVLIPRRIPLLRETVLPAKLTNGQTLPLTVTAGQEISFDLGRFAQAYTTLEIEADLGATLLLAHADISYTARAGRQTYLSSDTCGFQTGILRVKTGSVVVHGFGAVERVYPFDCVGRFRSSDPVLDNIWAMCARSVQVMSEDSYVDCADRERTEWMDNDPPAFDITRTALAGPGAGGRPLYADPRLLEEMLRRTALTLQPDGWVKAHTCSDRFDIHAKMEDRACDWVQGARRYYESTHSLGVVREIWPAIVTQMDWLLARRTARGLVRAREWVVWGNPMGYQTCEGAGLNAFVYKALVDAAFLGKAIGAGAQAARFARAAKDLAAAFNTVLWDESAGTYYSGVFGEGDAPTSSHRNNFHLKVEDGLAEPTFFPALFALDQGIVPVARRRQVTQYLLANRGQAARIMTFYYLFQQMYAQRDPVLDKEIIDTIRTRWADMAATGWKTSGEDFRGGSRAHIYGSFPGYFLSAFVLGVRREGPVWERRLRIEPRLGGLSHAAGTVVTEFGPVPVSWTADSHRLDFQAAVPANVQTTLSLPVTRANQTLRIDGRQVKGRAEGNFLTVTLAGGHHTGTLT